MSISETGGDSIKDPTAPADVANASNKHGSGAPPISIGQPERLDASADRARAGAARHGGASRVIDARAISVVGRSGDASGAGRSSSSRPILRYAGAGALAAAAAAGLAFMGGNHLGAKRSDSAAAEAVKTTLAHAATAPVIFKDPEMSRQLAQMEMDVRLLSARVETLRATVESHQPGDGDRALKKSIETVRANVEQSRLDTSRTLLGMAQKLDRLQHEPGAKLAQIAERLDRIDRRAAAAADVTGSIAKPPASIAAPPPPPSAKPIAAAAASPLDAPGSAGNPTLHSRPAAASLPGPKIIMPASLPEPKTQPKPQPKAIAGYILRDMEGDVAIVEGHGQIFELVNGDNVPGIGRVEGFERRGREWVVVTSRGVITSHSHD